MGGKRTTNCCINYFASLKAFWSALVAFSLWKAKKQDHTIAGNLSWPVQLIKLISSLAPMQWRKWNQFQFSNDLVRRGIQELTKDKYGQLIASSHLCSCTFIALAVLRWVHLLLLRMTSLTQITSISQRPTSLRLVYGWYAKYNCNSSCLGSHIFSIRDEASVCACPWPREEPKRSAVHKVERGCLIRTVSVFESSSWHWMC